MPAARATTLSAIDRVGHTLTDKAEAILREQIVGGARTPGARLNEVEIAAELAVSRGPVREAMQRLARDGLVRLESHRGAFVRALDAEEVRSLFEVRAALEGMAAELAADRASTEQIAALRELTARSRGAVEREAEPHYPQQLDLHALIARCCANPALQGHLRIVHSELALVRAVSGSRPVRAPRAVDEHIRIVEAIAAHDAGGARAAMTDHLESALGSMLGLLRGSDKE